MPQTRTGATAPLPPARLAVLNDFLVQLHDLYGVTATIRGPLVPPDRNPWDWGRPWICDAIRRVPGLLAKCDASEAAACAVAGRGPALARCHAGLDQFAIPLRWRDRTWGHVLCSPARIERGTRPVAARMRAAVGDLGLDVGLAEWGIGQFAVLTPEIRAGLVRSVETFFPAFMDAASRPAHELGATHLTVRGSGLNRAWLSFLWAGFERHTEEPGDGPWFRHRAHDVIACATRAPVGLVLPSRRVSLKPGQVAVIPAGRRYRVDPVDSAAPEPFWVHVVSSVDLRPLAFRPVAVPLAGRSVLRRLMAAAPGRSLFDFELEDKLRVLDWLLELRRTIGGLSGRGRPAAPSIDAAVARVQRHVQEHLAERLTLTELARLAGLNPFTLCRRFKAEHGLPPLAYHRRLKTQEAVRLLRETALPVKAIAFRLGYAGLHHFGRSLRELTGQSPRGVRRGALRAINVNS